MCHGVSVIRERRVHQLSNWRVEIGARAAALVLVFTASVVTGSISAHPWQIPLLVTLAVAAVTPVRSATLRRWRPLMEAATAALLVTASDPYDPSLLPYLVVPSLSAGLLGGWTLAIITAGGTGLVLLLRGAIVPDGLAGTEYLVDVTQWTLLAAAVGLLAAWIRRVQSVRPSDAASYREAARLLTQLRDLSRELSGGLDVVALGTALLDSVRDDLGADRGWVFAYRPGGLPLAIASSPPGEALIDASLTKGTLWHRTIAEGRATSAPSSFTADPTLCSAVAPMRVHDGVVGLVGVERRGQEWSETELVSLQAMADAEGTRFEAAMLFDEVRTLATAEERQRLAREIHDGVAQEIASLGYLLDDIAAHSTGETRTQLSSVRGELSRLVSELRFSIFDLRREVGPGVSLTGALADHARYVGEAAGITMHLELSESPRRLRPAAEAELLRIGQEAIANARKHARADNIWIVCRIEAPDVYLRIDDDGRGRSPDSQFGFGLDIMRERAERAGCTLTINDRSPRGTSVEVVPQPSGTSRRLLPGRKGGDRAHARHAR